MYRSATRACVAFLTVFLTGCGESSGTGVTDPDPDPVPTARNVPGTFTRSITVGGMSRTFIEYVGSSVGTSTAAPIVMVIHGTGQDGQRFYDISTWRARADENGLIILFPNALHYCYREDKNGDGDFTDPGDLEAVSKWTDGKLGDPAARPFCSPADVATLNAAQQAAINHPFQDDILFVDAMVSYEKQNRVINEKRINGTGFSNGAGFTSRLAIERSNLFAALGGHAGTLGPTPVPGRAMSFAHTLGSRDDGFTAFLGVPAIQISSSLLTTYPALAAIFVGPMLTQLKLTQAYVYTEPVVGGKKVGRFTFSTSTVGATNSYTFSVIEDNTHEYPNGSNHPLVMASVLWSFFQTQQLP